MNQINPYHPPDWFWDVLERTRPDLARLESWLMAASAEQVRQFADAFENAAMTLCDYWDGPMVDGIQYSEDDTEDLCQWIVSQGRDLWTKLMNGKLDLTDVARHIARSEIDKLPAKTEEWNSTVNDLRHFGYQSPECIAHAVYYSRFGTRISDV